MSPLEARRTDEASRDAQAERQARHVQLIASLFKGCKPSGDNYMARCPCHDDHDPSLAIGPLNNGGVGLRCHAGCDTSEILTTMDLRWNDLKAGANPKLWASTYSYCDEAGEILYQKIRFATLEGKTFSQRRRTPDGWEWKLGDVRRVLYNLPKIHQSPRFHPVYFVEGEKDADRLIDLGVLATCHTEGAGGAWRDEYSKQLEGREVVILPDDDPAGWEHARHVASQLRKLAKSVKLVDWTPLKSSLGNGESIKDVSDLLDAGVKWTDVLDVINNTPPNTQQPNGSPVGRPVGCHPTRKRKIVKNRSEPVGLNPTGRAQEAVGDTNRDVLGVGLLGPLGRTAVAPFPVDVLPQVLKQFAESVAAALPCPVDFIGTMMLPVLATCIGRRRRIQIKASWREYAVLWTAVVARSGDRKSPAFEIVTGPLRIRQQQLHEEYKQAMRVWRQGNEEGPKPLLAQSFTNDTTVEALKDVLVANPLGVCYPADELSGLARSLGQYKGGHGDDRQAWLSIWSSKSIMSNRRSNTEPIFIRDPFVCVTGGIQPDMISDLVSGREDGFAARLLFSWPDPVPHRDWTEDILQRSDDYHDLCQQLWDLKQSFNPVTLDERAKAEWADWVNQHRKEDPADPLRPVWSKAEGHCLRLTLVLHLARLHCKETKSEQVDLASMRGGIQLVEYFKSHACRVYGHVDVATDTSRVGQFLRWIRRRGGTVTARDAHMHGAAKDSNEAKLLFQYLAEKGHGTVSEGRQGSVVFQLHDNPTPNTQQVTKP